MTKREEHLMKIARTRNELKTAGPVHRRDLLRCLARLEREIKQYDRYRKVSAAG